MARDLGGRSVRNVASVTAAEPDPDTGDRTDDAVTAVDVEPGPTGSISVTKTAEAGAVVQLGRPVPYVIAVRNESSQPATGVATIDKPSAPVDVVSAVPQQGSCDKKTLRCELGTLAPGQTVTIRVVMIPRRPGALSNSVTAFSDQGDANAEDNLGVAGLTVRAARTKFKLAKSAARRTVKAGGRVAYVIRAKNHGSRAAANVRVCDVPRAGLSFARITGAKLSRGRACWTVAVLEAGQDAHVPPGRPGQPRPRGQDAQHRDPARRERAHEARLGRRPLDGRGRARRRRHRVAAPCGPA